MIKYTISFISAVIISAFSFGACSSGSSCILVSPPKIQLTGNKTAVERQIVGEYRELEKDAWVVSSVKTNVQKTKGEPVQTAGDRELFKAMKIRELLASKVRGYKEEGAIGETNTGYIKYISVTKYDADKNALEILQKIVAEENSARKLLFTRSLARTGKQSPSEEDLEGFGRIFADEQSALAKKDEWIQDRSGQWNRKR